MWRCRKCETYNNGEICEVCNEAKPIYPEKIEYTREFSSGSDNKTNMGQVLAILFIVIMIIVLFAILSNSNY